MTKTREERGEYNNELYFIERKEKMYVQIAGINCVVFVIISMIFSYPQLAFSTLTNLRINYITSVHVHTIQATQKPKGVT